MKKVVWKHNIGDHIVRYNKQGVVISDLLITNREVRLEQHKIKGSNSYCPLQVKYYEYQCNVCGATGLWKRESHITSSGCPCCRNKAIIKGINTIGDLYPQLSCYFANQEDMFSEELTLDSRYDVICPKCKHTKNMRLGHLLDQNFTCDYCRSVEAKAPELIPYLVNRQDAQLAHTSSKKIAVQCPNCGNQRSIPIERLQKRHSMYCDKCDDGIPFTEKLLIAVLQQLDIPFVTQASRRHLPWAQKYRYDFYLPDNEIIIETHGEQHYKRYGEIDFWRPLEEEQQNDKDKQMLAINNNIKQYIVLDCRQSSLEWIKQSIEQSAMANLFDLSVINWKECERFATNNMTKAICDYWNSNPLLSTTDVAAKFNLSTSGVVKCLKKGATLNWCTYNPQKELEKARTKTIATCAKRVAVFKDGNLAGTFSSLAETVRQSVEKYNVQFSAACISYICQGKAHTHRGYTFQFID